MMIKYVYCLKRHEELTISEFKDYWEGNYRPLLSELAADLKLERYCCSFAATFDRESIDLNAFMKGLRHTQDGYDGVVELYWESKDVLDNMINSQEGQMALTKMVNAETNFIDLENSACFFANSA